MTSDLQSRVEKLETDMEDVKATLAQVATLQLRTQQQLTEANQYLTQRIDEVNNTLAQRIDEVDNKLGQRIDSFIRESQRVLANLGDRSAKTEALAESNTDAIGRLTTNSEADRNESRAFRQQMESLTSRLDQLVNYLMRSRDNNS